MKNIISARLAGYILLTALGLLIVFHVLVLAGIVPPDIVWGGQAAAPGGNPIVLELIALALTIIFALIVWFRLRALDRGAVPGGLKIGIWIVFAYLAVNLLGNLASGVSAENFIFAPVTLVLALLALRLAVEK